MSYCIVKIQNGNRIPISLKATYIIYLFELLLIFLDLLNVSQIHPTLGSPDMDEFIQSTSTHMTRGHSPCWSIRWSAALLLAYGRLASPEGCAPPPRYRTYLNKLTCRMPNPKPFKAASGACWGTFCQPKYLLTGGRVVGGMLKHLLVPLMFSVVS